jgi:hypothetical protein
MNCARIKNVVLMDFRFDLKKVLSFGTVVMIINLTTIAQKTTNSVQQMWFSYNNQTRLSNKWGLWGDFHLRTKEDFVEDLSTGIARVGIMYYLKDNTKLTAGYAFVNHFPADAHPDISQPEHRPWQQIQWHNRFPKLRMMQWVRLEERFRRKIKDNDELADGYNFNWRVRYNLMLNFALNKKPFAPKTISYAVNNETHINFGKEIVYNTFDQNRLFVGLHYHANAHDLIQFGYMYLYQQLASGNRYRYVHAGRISYFHNLDLRKKEPSPKL